MQRAVPTVLTPAASQQRASPSSCCLLDAPFAACNRNFAGKPVRLALISQLQAHTGSRMVGLQRLRSSILGRQGDALQRYHHARCSVLLPSHLRWIAHCALLFRAHRIRYPCWAFRASLSTRCRLLQAWLHRHKQCSPHLDSQCTGHTHR